MAAAVELVPMFCTKCQSPIQAHPDEVAWVCPQCQQGLLLSDALGLEPVVVHFSAALTPSKVGFPFWVAVGQVNMLDRITFRGDERSAMLGFWQSPHQFFVPAFTLPLEQLIESGSRLLKQPPQLQSGSPTAFQSATLRPSDMQPVAEFIVLAIEAERKDQLRTLNFKLNLADPELWILP
ncbi:MAG: hypothetical protein P4L50_27200 [Anaerolineaceae bacterium]|nr:hypothetical protein [Anaerolineaceae bacterium]